jgi:3-hydroxyisobutyrate dehydrogenase
VRTAPSTIQRALMKRKATVVVPRIGFIGIGSMGWPMAACLVKSGIPVMTFDSRTERTVAFTREHPSSSAAPSLAELAARSDIVITMLPDSDIVGRVLFGPGDCLANGLKSGSIIAEMSSGVPAKTVGFAQRMAASDVAMIDAPVSGGVARAVTGDLAIMVGGEDAPVARCETALRAMGSSILRTGSIGSGQAMKALNNLVSAAGFLIGIEALLIGARFGLDPAKMVDALNASSGMNNSTQRKFKQFVLSRSFASGFGLDLMVKDLTIALEVGRETRTPAPFAALCRELWSAAAQTLGPGHDHTAAAKLSEMLAGTSLGGN